MFKVIHHSWQFGSRGGKTMKVIQTQNYEDKLSINGVSRRVFSAAMPGIIANAHQEPIKLWQSLDLVQLTKQGIIFDGFFN